MKFRLNPWAAAGLALAVAAQAASAAIANVSVINFAFVPATTNIAPSDTVIWTWPSGSSSHDVHSTSTPQAWTNPGVHNGPFAFTNTFGSSGTFPYNCTIHGFTGSIVVITNPNSPPTITITNPANGAVFAAPATVTLRASATDSDGTVTNVQFRVGTTVLTNDTTAPFTGTTNNLAAGSYSLSAVAFDNFGAKNTNTISINVVTPVAVALTNTTKFAGTNFQFSYAANVGLSYVIERTIDFAPPLWVPVATNVAASNSVVFVDPGATNGLNFYRVGRMPNP